MAFYRKHLQNRRGAPKGSTPNAIQEAEAAVGHKFPEAYVQYLLWMGDDVDGVFRGSEWFLKDLKSNNADLDEFLAENGIVF